MSRSTRFLAFLGVVVTAYFCSYLASGNVTGWKDQPSPTPRKTPSPTVTVTAPRR